MSDEQTPETTGRKGWPKGKPRGARASSEATSAEAVGAPSEAPVVKVTSRRSAALERRLSPNANPHSTGSRKIPLKEPERWQLYIANDYAGQDDLYRMVHEYGWLPLDPADLDCRPEEIGYRVNESNHLVRGPQGREVVFKMDKRDYALLVQRKTEANMRGMGSQSKTKAMMAEATGAAFGSAAGDFIDKQVFGNIRDTREVMP